MVVGRGKHGNVPGPQEVVGATLRAVRARPRGVPFRGLVVISSRSTSAPTCLEHIAQSVHAQRLLFSLSRPASVAADSGPEVTCSFITWALMSIVCVAKSIGRSHSPKFFALDARGTRLGWCSGDALGDMCWACARLRTALSRCAGDIRQWSQFCPRQWRIRMRSGVHIVCVRVASARVQSRFGHAPLRDQMLALVAPGAPHISLAGTLQASVGHR